MFDGANAAMNLEVTFVPGTKLDEVEKKFWELVYVLCNVKSNNTEMKILI